MKLSVLIAAYRAEATLAAALASVQGQTHADWEIVVVEDGSRDGTEALVHAAAAVSPQPIRYANLGHNQGVAAARNRLMQLAAGDAFAFLDADDTWTPDHLARGAAQLAAGADLVVMGVQTFDLATGQNLAVVHPPAELERDPVRALFEESVIITSSCVLLTRALWQRAGDFDETFRVGEDRDYWLRAASIGAAVKIDAACTCRYAKHAGSTMARALLVSAQISRFYEKHAVLDAVPVARRQALLAHSLVNEARLLRASDPRTSLRLLWRAWRLEPGDLRIAAHLLLSAGPAFSGAASPRYVLVADQLGGQCRYSGIHQLARFLRSERSVQIIETPDTSLRRSLGKVWSLLRGWPVRNQSQAFSEFLAGWTLATSSPATIHFLVGENHVPFLTLPRTSTPVIVTLHMPASLLASPRIEHGRVHTLVLLSTRDAEAFAGLWGARQTVVIPHGVDTEFFRPGPPPARSSVLIVGRFLRDFPLTAATVLLLAARHPEWTFDFVVPASAWHGPDLAAVRSLPGVHWHDRIDDEALRHLYQTASCHLSPFLDCTANNALVESLACGLPVVTTDRGGVRDYGAGEIYPLVSTHTAAALAELCERYLASPVWRQEISAACRQFAVTQLAWPVIARRHLALYAQVAQAMQPAPSPVL